MTTATTTNGTEDRANTAAIVLADSAHNPLGPAEVAELLGVKRETVHQWVYRGWTPEPSWRLSGIPVWTVRTILGWASDTGRLPGGGGRCSLVGCDTETRAKGLCRRHYRIGFGK